MRGGREARVGALDGAEELRAEERVRTCSTARGHGEIGTHIDVRMRDADETLQTTSDAEDLGRRLRADDGRDVGSEERDARLDVLEDLRARREGSAQARAKQRRAGKERRTVRFDWSRLNMRSTAPLTTFHSVSDSCWPLVVAAVTLTAMTEPEGRMPAMSPCSSGPFPSARMTRQ